MLNPNVKAKLLQAVDLAINPGECKYVLDNKPACVVAQYMVLNGVSTATLIDWESITIQKLAGCGENLFGAPKDLLVGLQGQWDRGWPSRPPPVDETRTKMRSLIEEADRA